MILATQSDVEARLGRDLSDGEIQRLDGLLEEASAIVEGYLGVVYTDDAPPVVAVVVSKLVARAFTSGQTTEGPTGFQAGPFSVTYRDNTSLWLSKGDKLMLRNIGGGFTSVPLRSDRGYGS